MSTIFDRLGAVLVTWYPHFTRNPFEFPRACPHLPLMRRVGAASAGCALWQISAEAAGYVGGEGHVFPLDLIMSHTHCGSTLCPPGMAWMMVSRSAATPALYPL